MSKPGDNTLTKGHIDKINELFSVFLNVEIKESYQKIMNS